MYDKIRLIIIIKECKIKSSAVRHSSSDCEEKERNFLVDVKKELRLGTISLEYE